MLPYNYRSTDPGMPVLSGTAGALLGVLDLLVNGGATQSITSITRSGSTATATKVAHGFRDQVRVLHAGADQADYNIESTITVIDADHYSFTVANAPVTPATGALTAKMAGAGWGKPFSATNVGVYRPPAGLRPHLRLDDTGGDATNAAKVATMRAFMAMTDVNTGTDDYPTVAQLASGLFVGKSTTADGTARKWNLQADTKRMVLCSAYHASLADGFANYEFGDLVGASAADAYATMIAGATTSANALQTNVAGAVGYGQLLVPSANAGIYMPRNASGTGTSVPVAAFSACSVLTGNSTLTAGPDASGNVWADAVAISGGTAATDAPRGHFPGLKYLRNNLPFATYGAYYTFGSHLLVRCASSHGNAYLIDLGDWG